MEKSIKIRRMVGISILSVLVIVLQLLSNYVQLGPVCITLALIPIVVGAILYGPLAGFILGAVDGLMIFVAPSTITLFWPVSVVLTLFVCVLKTGLAGLVSGLIFKAFQNKNMTLGTVLASIIVPIVNTGLFAIFTILFYQSVLAQLAPEGQNLMAFLFLAFIGYNFIIEFVVNSALSPVVLKLVLLGTNNYNIGSSLKK